jgi:hypothetical protein
LFEIQIGLLSSCIEVVCAQPTELIEVDVDAGDSYFSSKGLSKIDFLKIDVEGMEGNVLQGFSKTLSQGLIKIIQFEYGMVNISSHFLLKDFYDFLVPYGYRIGKIYPNFVKFRDYSWWRDEDFKGPNFVAVLQTEDEIIPLLAN